MHIKTTPDIFLSSYRNLSQFMGTYTYFNYMHSFIINKYMKYRSKTSLVQPVAIQVSVGMCNGAFAFVSAQHQHTCNHNTYYNFLGFQ